MLESEKELNKVLEEKTGISKEKLLEIQKLKKIKGKDITLEEISDGLKKINPNLAKFLIIETLENDFIKKKYGAYPNSTIHQIKDLINNNKSEYNGIENIIERLESLSINMIHENLRKNIKFEEGLNQDAFIQKHLDKRIQSFNLLPDRLQILNDRNKRKNTNKIN